MNIRSFTGGTAGGGYILPSSERVAIEDAFKLKIAKLFDVLVEALITERDEQEAVERFAAGLNVARRARELALGVIEPPDKPNH